MTSQPSFRFVLAISAGPRYALRFGLNAVDDGDARRKAAKIVTRLEVRHDAFVELTRANGTTVNSADSHVGLGGVPLASRAGRSE